MDVVIIMCKCRTFVVHTVQEKYPTSEELDNMQAYFEQYGSVAHIERRIRGYNGAKVGTVCC